MAFCRQCGSQLADSSQFCPSCGAKQAIDHVEESSQYQQQSYQPYDEQAQNRPRGGNQDVQDNKAIAILSYIGLLSLIPYLAAKHSPFAQYHAVRGLNLLICEAIFGAACFLVTAILSLIFSWFGGVIGSILNLGWIFFLVVSVIGIINVCNGEKKDLPYIGRFQFVKE